MILNNGWHIYIYIHEQAAYQQSYWPPIDEWLVQPSYRLVAYCDALFVLIASSMQGDLSRPICTVAELAAIESLDSGQRYYQLGTWGKRLDGYRSCMHDAQRLGRGWGGGGERGGRGAIL